MSETTSPLQELDTLLTALRQAVQRPTYRRRLLHGLDIPGAIATVRILRAVRILSDTTSPAIKDVAAHLAIEHSTASRGVEAAARAGLLVKRSCADDQRRARLELTAAGSALLRRTSTRRRQILEEITDGWPDEDIDRLVELLGALRAGFDRLEGHPPATPEAT